MTQWTHCMCTTKDFSHFSRPAQVSRLKLSARNSHDNGNELDSLDDKKNESLQSLLEKLERVNAHDSPSDNPSRKISRSLNNQNEPERLSVESETFLTPYDDKISDKKKIKKTSPSVKNNKYVNISRNIREVMQSISNDKSDDLASPTRKDSLNKNLKHNPEIKQMENFSKMMNIAKSEPSTPRRTQKQIKLYPGNINNIADTDQEIRLSSPEQTKSHKCYGCGKLMPKKKANYIKINYLWHIECFSCSKCNSPLDLSNFTMKLGLLFCSKCI